jgi:hypothetical protein
MTFLYLIIAYVLASNILPKCYGLNDPGLWCPKFSLPKLYPRSRDTEIYLQRTVSISGFCAVCDVYDRPLSSLRIPDAYQCRQADSI